MSRELWIAALRRAFVLTLVGVAGCAAPEVVEPGPAIDSGASPQADGGVAEGGAALDARPLDASPSDLGTTDLRAADLRAADQRAADLTAIEVYTLDRPASDTGVEAEVGVDEAGASEDGGAEDATSDAGARCVNDQDCDDGLLCNGAERCAGLFCIPGIPPAVPDPWPCTTDSCDETNGVTRVPEDGVCDDGRWCNGAEVCSATTGCGPGVAPQLGDGVGCTLDQCDETSDTVRHIPHDSTCDDFEWCNGTETCHRTGGCQPGTPPALDDGVDCTIDSCDEVSDTVLHVPDHGVCDDFQWCTGEERCDAVVGCLAGVPRSDDGIACTVDSCDEMNQLVRNVADDNRCDDGEMCNGMETCDPVHDCQPGTPELAGTSCEGQLFCRNGGTCDASGACDSASGSEVLCPDTGDICTDDVCTEAARGCTTSLHVFTITGNLTTSSTMTQCPVDTRRTGGRDFAYSATCNTTRIDVENCYGTDFNCRFQNGVVWAELDRGSITSGNHVTSGCSYASVYGQYLRCCLP